MILSIGAGTTYTGGDIIMKGGESTFVTAGTGGATQQIRRVASDRDNIVIEAREEEARQAVALAAPTEEPAEE